MEDIIKFGDFLKNPKIIEKIDIEILGDRYEEEEEIKKDLEVETGKPVATIEGDLPFDEPENLEYQELEPSEIGNNEDEIIEDESDEIIENIDELINKAASFPVNENKELYKFYTDKSEEFYCDISIQGADTNKRKARLVIESNEWNLVFNGKIEDGKCIIPIKKLSLLEEGTKGKAKLEIIVDDMNIFTPWEDDFIILTEKKVNIKKVD